MKHNKAQSLLARLSALENSAELRSLADEFGLSYGEAAGISGFYSRFNGLPAEERLQPVPGPEGPILRHAAERPCCGLEKLRSGSVDIIDMIERSGLSGRGGAAFPTGEKWRGAKFAPADEKFVICNVSEGEPGTAKDLFLLLRYPEAVLEGMAICALAIGASRAIVYIRHGYSDAADKLRRAIEGMKDVLSPLSIEVTENPGAYVCGEETALISSLEGSRGESRRKPPFPTERGLLGRPSVINNAETFAAIPVIADLGPEFFAENESRLFTVTGCGAAPTVCEMPVNSTAEAVFAAAGCSAKPKAFQLGGGASGKIYPADYMSVPLRSPEAEAKGIVMGTGSLRFISSEETLRSICGEIMEFFSRESCGKCTPCRLGCAKLSRMLASGCGRRELRTLAEHIAASSFCPLGKSVGNALLSAMEHFPEEFDVQSEKEVRS